jgi:penicillin-binding protein 2
MQLATAVATLANGGTAVRPRLVRAVQDARTQQVRELPLRNGEALALKPEHVELVRAAMADVTRPGGTAARMAQGAPYLMAGKTGTAQVIAMKAGEKYDEKRVKERHRDHALFIAYAPADDPKIALALLVENGGHGGSTAGPIAREVFDFYLIGKRPERKPKLGDEESEGD